MKRWIPLLLVALVALGHALPAQAQAQVQTQARSFGQAELDALLAPVALYPDPVLSHVLVAATFPDELEDAAAWSRTNPQLSGENAVRAAEAMPWPPSVKALVAFPELLARMAESPQWVADLGTAFLAQEPQVMDTVQALRRRAQASGHLQSNAQQQVYDQGGALAVYPAHPQVVYVPYYDPFAVYGPFAWHHRPVYWRPWHAHPTAFAFTHVFFVRSVDWHRRHVVHHQRHHDNRHHFHARPLVRPATPVTVHNHARPVRPIVDSVRLPAQHAAQPPRRETHHERREVRTDVHHGRRAAPSAPFGTRSEAHTVRPIVDSVRLPQHAAPFAAHNAHRQAQPQVRQQVQPQPRREHRPSVRQEPRGHARRG
jgi:hypothetical protein